MSERPPEPSWYDDLDGFERHCWSMLERGVADRRSPFHTPTVCTIGMDGSPRARVVVLRAAAPGASTLRFHTDTRSDKHAELRSDPRVEAVFYDAGRKLQLRASGHANIHEAHEGDGKAAWSATRSFSRQCYRVEPGPGTPLINGGDYVHPNLDDEGAANFRAVTINVRTIEALYLASAGHRRAVFGEKRSWLVP